MTAPAGVDHAAVVREYGRAWNDHDVDRILAFHTDTSVFEVVGLLSVQGHEAIREAVSGLFLLWPGMAFQERDLRAGGSFVVHEFEMTARLGIELTIGGRSAGPTESAIRFRGVDVITLEGDRVARKTTYLDYLSAQRELGLA